MKGRERCESEIYFYIRASKNNKIIGRIEKLYYGHPWTRVDSILLEMYFTLSPSSSHLLPFLPPPPLSPSTLPTVPENETVEAFDKKRRVEEGTRVICLRMAEWMQFGRDFYEDFPQE